MPRVSARVRVRFFGTLRMVTPATEVTFNVEEGKAISGLLKRLADELGPDFQRAVFESNNVNTLSRNMWVIVNGRNIMHLNGLDTKLHDGDVISIVPPIGGG